MKHDKFIWHTYYVMYMNTRRATLIVKDRAIQNEICFVIHLFCNVHAFSCKIWEKLDNYHNSCSNSKKIGNFLSNWPTNCVANLYLYLFNMSAHFLVNKLIHKCPQGLIRSMTDWQTTQLYQHVHYFIKDMTKHLLIEKCRLHDICWVSTLNWPLTSW